MNLVVYVYNVFYPGDMHLIEHKQKYLSNQSKLILIENVCFLQISLCKVGLQSLPTLGTKKL